MFYMSNLLNFLKSKKEFIFCSLIYWLLIIPLFSIIKYNVITAPTLITFFIFWKSLDYFTFNRSNLMLAYIVDFLFIQYYKLRTPKNVQSSMTNKLQIWARNITHNYKIEKLEKEGSLLKPKLNSMLQLIKDMHKKFGISNDVQSRLSKEEKAFRVACLREEIREFEESENIADELDGILDCVVFCFGTLERMGLLEISEESFNRIMTANLQKELGGSKKREGTPAFSIDLKKPKNFKPPKFDDLLNK